MLETIYNDFTTKLLPQVQQGLSITKDYFFDLFGRYIKYLIIQDSITIVVSFVATIICAYITYKLTIYFIKEDDSALVPLIMFPLIGAIMLGVWFFISIDNLIKDIYIPEIRVMEQLSTKIN